MADLCRQCTSFEHSDDYRDKEKGVGICGRNKKKVNGDSSACRDFSLAGYGYRKANADYCGKDTSWFSSWYLLTALKEILQLSNDDRVYSNLKDVVKSIQEDNKEDAITYDITVKPFAENLLNTYNNTKNTDNPVKDLTIDTARYIYNKLEPIADKVVQSKLDSSEALAITRNAIATRNLNSCYNAQAMSNTAKNLFNEAKKEYIKTTLDLASNPVLNSESYDMINGLVNKKTNNKILLPLRPFNTSNSKKDNK